MFELAQQTFSRITTDLVLISANSAMLQDKRNHVVRDASLSCALIEVFGLDFHVCSFRRNMNLRLTRLCSEGTLALFPLTVCSHEQHGEATRYESDCKCRQHFKG
jgi:hypothetical protein